MREMEQILIELKEIRVDVHILRDELQRYKGFVGGVMWCVSALTAMVGFVWGNLSVSGKPW